MSTVEQAAARGTDCHSIVYDAKCTAVR
jgi:hypothetical protein